MRTRAVGRFAVTNVGTVTLTDVTVVDPMLDAAGVDVSCPRDRLPVGASMVCTSEPYTITAADQDAGSVENVATAEGTSPTGDAVVSDDSAAVVPVEEPGDLPDTGAAFSWWLPLLGMGLLGAGCLIVLLAWPRRRRPA